MTGSWFAFFLKLKLKLVPKQFYNSWTFSVHHVEKYFFITFDCLLLRGETMNMFFFSILKIQNYFRTILKIYIYIYIFFFYFIKKTHINA